MVDYLPDKRWFEYAHHKWHNPEVEYHNWNPWDEWDYPEQDILRFKHIIGNQKEFISNKKVLDLACHLGYTSLFLLHNGATHVTGTNIEQRELEIAKEICTRAGYQNFDFEYSNLYNKQELKTLCDNHDTVLLTGVLYHLNNHYEILETLCKSKATTVIIESKTTMNHYEYNCQVPLITWANEETYHKETGWYYNEPTAFVGMPNTAWITQALESLHMEIVYNQAIEYIKHENGKKTRRVTITATKK